MRHRKAASATIMSTMASVLSCFLVFCFGVVLGCVVGEGGDACVDGEEGAIDGAGQGDDRGGPHRFTFPENEELGKPLKARGMLPVSLLLLTLS